MIAQIDSRAYEAQVMQYQGQLSRDKALLENAKLDLARYKILYPQGGVSKQILDTQVSLVRQYEGTVKSDLGLLQGAQVNLSYCHIVSPVNGKIGLRLVDEGNIVQPSNTTGLVVINVTNPMDVAFSIPEDDLPKVMEKLNAGQSLEVSAFDRTQSKILANGKLFATDNQIDPSTGTLKLKAEFENKNNNLFPNQFVNIRLLLETLKDVLVVPVSSVQHNNKGDYVYLTTSNQKAHVQTVITGPTQGDKTVIMSGLILGQEVITEGIDKLYEGAPVSTGKMK